MPELPEVETIKRGLESKIIGLTISQVDVLYAKSFQGDPDLLIGAKITRLWRRAKLLGIDLQTTNNKRLAARIDKKATGSQLLAVSGKLTLLFHLKMSGQLIFTENFKFKNKNSAEPFSFAGGHPTKDMLGTMPNNSTRVVFTLISFSNRKPNTSHLYFNDQRKFGWIKLANSQQLLENSFLQSLGPEPLEKDFTPQILKQVLMRHPRLSVKVAILDQSAIAGIGNIYASEACFLAGIHPQTTVSKLSDTDFTNLQRAIINSLQASIKYGGSSKHTFVNEVGGRGYFLDVANVYDRQGLPCRVCSTRIIKTTLAGRGTYFCPICQPINHE